VLKHSETRQLFCEEDYHSDDNDDDNGNNNEDDYSVESDDIQI